MLRWCGGLEVSDKTPTDTDLLVTLSIFIHCRQPPPPDTPEHAATLQVG